MAIKTLEDVVAIIDQEGFDYAFCDYSNFEDVKDEEFHKLRKNYIEAKQALENYLPESEW